MTPEEFWKILHDVPPARPISYRLYYSEDGTPVVYTMEDLPGKYIEIDATTYALASYNVKVVDGKLIEIVPKKYIRKLIPSAGTSCAVDDVTVVVDQTKPHTQWSIKDYETN